MPSPSQQKKQLRRLLRQRRHALSRDQVQKNSQAIVEKLIASELWAQSKHIGLYLPINNEVDLTALLKTDKTCYVPSIDGKTMQFHQHHSKLTLRATSFGLSQPNFSIHHKRPYLDLCLMPLVGFDQMGHRIGMGGGYYDRYFEDNKITVLVGVAHAVQQLDQLPIEPWDVTLDGIITEQKWLTI